TLATPTAQAALTTAAAYTGKVGLSVDGVGSTNAVTGDISALIPVGAKIEAAYFYAAGTPYPWYGSSPRTLDAYNAAGISLNGQTINNFSTLVGATSTRADLGTWYTARADVTSQVQSWVSGASTSSFSWQATEGNLSQYIDGTMLAVVYSHSSLAQGSVVLLDGGQATGGETTNVSLSQPLSDPNAADFVAQFGIASSFSCCTQASSIDINGHSLTQYAGSYDDGAMLADGSLFTVGGIGDDPSNNVGSYEQDDELYDLRPYLTQGDTSFKIFTRNPTNDDNIFFASLYTTAEVAAVNGNPVVTSVPEPQTYALMAACLGLLAVVQRKRQAQ
ncbi:MAG: hypothetical protein RLZZ182_2539, partial [Pseudomonadota bacterium]